MKPQKLLWLALYYLIPTILIGLIFGSPVGGSTDPLYRLSVVSGALAFVWLVNQLVISARPKFIEKHFGMDRLYRFHAWMAVVSVGLVIVHRQSKLAWMGFAPTTAQIAAILFILAVLFAVVFLADTRLRRLKFVQKMVRFADQKLGLGFNRVVLFHNLTVVASVLMVIHVLTTGAADLSLPVRVFYWVYFGLGAGFYLAHKVVRPWLQARRAYQVAAVIEELPNIRTLQLTPPENQPLLAYQPGQFAFIKPLGGDVPREEHPFTISSSPVNREAITFTIKELGDFTASLERIQPGTPVRVDAPYGVFSYQQHAPAAPLGMIAGGIGITPILSMLRTLRETEPDRQVTFLWAVNQPEELFCQDELDAMAAEMPKFTWHPVVAFDETWPGEKGFVDQDKLARLLLNGDGGQTAMAIYLCGPKVMMDLVTGHLKALGVPAGRIRTERFSF
jgi:predicted ferric reductase